MNKYLYFCVGCLQVHFDADYNAEDGDLLITDWAKFLMNIERVKGEIKNG